MGLIPKKWTTENVSFVENDGKEAIADEEIEVHRGADRFCPPAG
jgi:hypothetical protein